VTALAGVGGLDELHALARRVVREVPGLVSAEFFTQAGLDILVAHAGLASPLPRPAAADGRHEDAVFRFIASLGGSISAEHGIGALKAPWLPLARTDAERALFARIRSALDPAGTLNPNVLPR
jgi:FAD/FMN-containing dehydrogenase